MRKESSLRGISTTPLSPSSRTRQRKLSGNSLKAHLSTVTILFVTMIHFVVCDRRLFWEQQRKAAKLKDGRGMRWHPMMIKWALNLKMLSSAAYHATRTSGLMSLPSQRSLRDYIHYYHSKAGFHSAVNDHLMREAKLTSSRKLRSTLSSCSTK